MFTTTRTRRLLIGSGLALASVLGAACGSDSASTSADTGGTQAETTGASGAAAEPGDAIEISGAWARTSPSEVDTGAAYMTITGGTDDDSLLTVEAPSTIAGMAQIHEMVPVSGGSDSSMAMGSDDTTDGTGGDGAMVMQEVKGGLEIPAGKTVELAPGGYHVMLMELAAPLKEGSTFDLTLTFEKAGEKTVSVEVRTEAP